MSWKGPCGILLLLEHQIEWGTCFLLRLRIKKYIFNYSMTLIEHRFGLSWKWLFNIIITICLQRQWRHRVRLASKPQRQRRERTSTMIHVCVHMYTHTHTYIYHPLVYLQFMTLWEREDFFRKASSVPWQTHKSFHFSAIKLKSFLKPVRSSSLC